TIGNIIKSRKKGGFIDVRTPFLVGSVSKGSAADKIGLKQGDSIIALNNEPVAFFDAFETAKQQNKGKQVTLTVVRNNNQVSMKGLLPADGVFGFRPDASAEKYFELETIKYGLGASIVKGFATTFQTFGSYL